MIYNVVLFFRYIAKRFYIYIYIHTHIDIFFFKFFFLNIIKKY